MSNKTIFKRIALVAVTALGAGVLSVAPASATDNNATGGAFVTPASNVMNIAVTPSNTGSALASITAATSVGLLANSTTMGTGLTQTATLLSTGTLGVYGQAAAGDAVSFVVTGGTIASAAATDALIFFNSNMTAATSQEDGTDAVTKFSITVKPTSGATSMRVEMYTTTVAEAVTTSQSIANGVTSRGTLRAAVNVTIATSSASGAYSAAESLINIDADGSGAATGVDETDANVIANGAASAGFINIQLEDAYGVSLTGLGALVVTATNGAGIKYNDAGGAATPVNLTDVSNDTTGTITVARPAAFKNRGFSTTVSIAWNGVVISTKSFKFLGEVATVTASSPKIGALSASSTSAFRLAYADDAGNALYPTITDTSAVAATLNTFVTGLSVGTIGSSTALAKGTLTCGASAGSADVQVQHVNPLSGTVVKSNVWKATCAGDAATYTASWDKASYTPGSIATLSITFKDADGNLANAYTAVSTTANPITITGGPSADAVTPPANLDAASSADGIKTYQFIVGTTEGDFSAVVAVPVVTANGVATNQTASYKVAAASGAVSLAQVLASVVSLIASINKQIQALQKLILKRR